MSDDQDGCEWVNVSSGTGLPGQKAVKQLCVCVCVFTYGCDFLLNHHFSGCNRVV